MLVPWKTGVIKIHNTFANSLHIRYFNLFSVFFYKFVGLITYRESALLFEPNVSSSSSQNHVASVIAHELAHQWFGNLVTMRWWVDLWLNEGFATYVASLGVQHLHPEWNAFQEESLENTVSVFEFDALKSSHPVSVQIGNPNQIPSIFDRISYDKGVNCKNIPVHS